jgi:uncharacterized protein (TIGR03083 family)
MTARDDDLAALLALDALESDEQADAELRLGTFAPGASEVSGALAAAAAAEPPVGLRAEVLATARSRRAPGRPVDAALPCSPADGFRRTVADLYALLRGLTDAEWDASAHPDHGAVRALIAHLIGVERLTARWLRQEPGMPDLPDHVLSTRPVVAELSGRSPAELAETWRAAALDVADAAAGADPAVPVTMHDLKVSPEGVLVIRTFELWAHAMDIATATGRPLLQLDPDRMATLSMRLMAAVPLALALRGTSAPGRTARFVLTGASGGSYSVPLSPGDLLGEPDFVLVADAVDLCRVAARRLQPDELGHTVEGDRELAGLVLAGLDAFARD